MDFSWREDQQALKAAMIDFAQRELNDRIVKHDRQMIFPREAWEKCAAFGIQALAAPAEFGGRGEIDILTATLAMEGLGYGCRDNGLPFALNAQMWTVQLPILHFGSQAQKERFLPKMVSGEWIGAHALTEPGSGSDAFNMETTAAPQDGGYVLNGRKKFVSLGPVADVVLVFASTKPEVGKWGISAFLVEKDRPGFQQGPNLEKMGLRTVPIGELIFTDCFLPAENRLGPEGAGTSISNNSLEYERCSILASQLGAMQRQLEDSIRYARERRQFGQPIGKFQSVSNRVAEMKLRLETARLLLYKVAWLKSQDQSAMLEAALLKLHLSESFVASGLDAIRVHGGSGYMTDFGIERDLRDAIGGILYAGTSDIQRNIIARLLGL